MRSILATLTRLWWRVTYRDRPHISDRVRKGEGLKILKDRRPE